MISERLQAELDRTDSKAVRLRYLASTNAPTVAEELLIPRLPGFTFQQPLLDLVVDFCNHETGVCVEVDGPYHWKQFRKDRGRDLRLYRELGICTLRIANETVIADPDQAAGFIRTWEPEPPSELDDRPVISRDRLQILKECEHVLHRWEPRRRRDVLADYELLEKFMQWGFEGQSSFLKKLHKRVVFWPDAGYPVH